MKDLPVLMKQESSEKPKGFPLEHYSYSSFTKMCNNPIMFKINNINGDVIDTTTSASAVLGGACHRALQAYLGGEKDGVTPSDEGEAIKYGHMRGLEYLHAFSDGFITWTTTIPNRAKLEEKYAFCYFGYIKDFNYQKKVKRTLIVEKMMKHRVNVEGRNLPIPLKGAPDHVYIDLQDRIIIEDHKFTGRWSDEDAIDGAKLIQAAFMYFLTYAELQVPPYAMVFREYKTTQNKDNSPQTKEYTIVFEETPMMFEFFYRLYQDVTDALMGKQVFLPNLNAMYDKEVSILAYIHRLDVSEERNKAFERMKVDNITDFLKKKIQKDSSMKKYLETVSANFISAETLNYKDMTIEERIKMKLAEHGLGVDFDSKVEGGSVTLYRYQPSIGLKMSKIEAYAKDIEQVVEVSGIRILAPIRDSGLVGFEVPKLERNFPTGIPASDGFNIAIGQSIMGEAHRIDIREAPHILVSGATGSGKSVFLNSLISQLSNTGSDLVLLDPKMVELIQWKGIARQYADDKDAIELILYELVDEMEKRYKELQKLGLRNIEGTQMKRIFVIIDEFGDLVVTSKGNELKKTVLLLAQKGRACGIHVVITTQRPSVKIIDGDIKANFPVRIAFRTVTATDSQVILDQAGAEKLLGKGDLLILGTEGVTRLQGYGL